MVSGRLLEASVYIVITIVRSEPCGPFFRAVLAAVADRKPKALMIPPACKVCFSTKVVYLIGEHDGALVRIFLVYSRETKVIYIKYL